MSSGPRVVAEKVWTRIASRLRGASALFIQTDEETASEDDQVAPIYRKRGLKLGNLHTADTVVTKRITWPHEVIYTSQGEPAIYEELSAVLFINGYLTVLVEYTEEVKGHMLWHLQELMEDAEFYGWRSVRDYHVAWLLKFEQGRAAWGDETQKMKLRRALVWH